MIILWIHHVSLVRLAVFLAKFWVRDVLSVMNQHIEILQIIHVYAKQDILMTIKLLLAKPAIIHAWLVLQQILARPATRLPKESIKPVQPVAACLVSTIFQTFRYVRLAVIYVQPAFLNLQDVFYAHQQEISHLSPIHVHAMTVFMTMEILRV